MSKFILVDLKKESIFNYVQILYKYKKTRFGTRLKNNGYVVNENIGYYSERYSKYVVCECGDKSDGATFAKDINSFSWIFHDDIKKYKKFENGTVCSNWQASWIIYDILKEEGRWFRARTWFISTLGFGTVF